MTSNDDKLETLDGSDEQLAELLDRYVRTLHGDKVETQSQLLRQHPELRPLVDCLNDLESLAPAVGERHQDFDDSQTIVVTPDGNQDAVPFVVPALAFPREFGKYELLKEIGRGGMGVVFMARQKDLDRPVALKMILANQLASNDEVRRFYVEAKAAGGLQHAHIVSIHEVGEVNGQHYFAMDYVKGPSLQSILKDGPMNPNNAAKTIVAVARAVHYLHEHNIIHRDLKPSNILLDENGIPYVTDFGLAKVFTEDPGQTQTGTIVGTPSYMAPEQASGRGAEVSDLSDVYGLGAILYETLTGRPPFRERNALETLVQVLDGEPTHPGILRPDLPRELQLICMQCLEKSPSNRFASAAELADDLERYLRGEPVTARQSDFQQRSRRWLRREPALVSRWLAITIAFLILQVNYLVGGDDLGFHVKITSILAAWMVVAFAFQKALNQEGWTDAKRYAWTASDAIFLTTLLLMADGPVGPLVIGYPMLIVASGLFFRMRLVAFMTLVCLFSYLALILLRTDTVTPVHYTVIFCGVMMVLGCVVAYQVYRLRVLSRYFESRRFP